MDFILLFLLLIILFSIKFYQKKFNTKFIDHTQTLCINGIFVILIFFRHITNYCTFTSDYSNLFNTININLDQLIVTTFLFYSGYGIYESIKNKENYIQQSLPNRIKKLYLKYLIAIISFLLINLLFNIKYNLKTVLLSFLAWESIGNSNWYIFAIITSYCITYLSFKLIKNKIPSLLSVTLFINLYIIIISFFKDSFWYNTIICFTFGLWFSYFKTKIVTFLTKNNYIYSLILIINILFFYIFNKLHSTNLLFYELWILSFISLIILISLKFKLNNKVFLFLGTHSFWIYILQRIPMILLQKLNIHISSPFLFVIISFILTIILSLVYKKIFDEHIFTKKCTN